MRKISYILISFLVAAILFGLSLFILNSNKDKGALQVTSSPPSKVYLNGKAVGQTPLCKCELKDMVDEGSYTIKLVPLDGNFSPFEQKIKISKKVLTVVDRNFASLGLETGSIISLVPIQDKKDAQVSVVSFPGASQVFLDNNIQGQSPLVLKNITDSDHELKLTKDGYKDKIIRIRTVLGYKLEALVFLGLNPDIATKNAASASSQAASFKKAKVLILDTPTGFLRVRQEPTVASAEITQVKPGETYDLLEEKSGWFKIQLKDGKEGWISSQYSKKES